MLRPIAALALLAAPSAMAHEFWLEPVAYSVPAGAEVAARAMNGENFAGTEFSYSPRAYERSGIVSGSGSEVVSLPLGGEAGQRPAVRVAPAGDGLNIVYHASPVMKLTYESFDKFESFLRGKHLEATLDAHKARGLPRDAVAEVYFRFAKALVAVGDGVGADRATGMPYELVALTNPYTDAGDMVFQLIYQGAAEADSPVDVFVKTPQGVTKTGLRTDAQGQVTVPRAPGAVLVNAVKMIEPDAALADRMGAMWVSLWASTVYSIAD